MQVDLGPGHILLDGDPAPPPPKGHSPPIFGPHPLLPNGCIDQDSTWYRGRPRPWPHCVRWGPSSPPHKGSGAPPLNFRLTFIVAKRLGPTWFKMVLGMEVGLSPGDLVVLDGAQPLPKKGAEPPPQFFGPFLLWPNGWMHQDATWHGGRPQPRRPCGVRWRPSHSPKRGQSPLPNFWPISIVAKRLDALTCHLARR